MKRKKLTEAQLKKLAELIKNDVGKHKHWWVCYWCGKEKDVGD